MEKPQGYKHLGCRPMHVTHQTSRPIGDFPATPLLPPGRQAGTAGFLLFDSWLSPLLYFWSFPGIFLLLHPHFCHTISFPSSPEFISSPFPGVFLSLSALQSFPSGSPTPALTDTPYSLCLQDVSGRPSSWDKIIPKFLIRHSRPTSTWCPDTSFHAFFSSSRWTDCFFSAPEPPCLENFVYIVSFILDTLPSTSFSVSLWIPLGRKGLFFQCLIGKLALGYVIVCPHLRCKIYSVI